MVIAAALADALGCAATAGALRTVLGHPAVVVTRGEAGSETADRSGAWHQPATTVEVVDTTAAGDCFVGVLAHRLDRGEPLSAATRRASHAAALCCTRLGTQTILPTAAETDRFAAVQHA